MKIFNPKLNKDRLSNVAIFYAILLLFIPLITGWEDYIILDMPCDVTFLLNIYMAQQQHMCDHTTIRGGISIISKLFDPNIPNNDNNPSKHST